MEPVLLVFGQRFLHSSYCWKLDPVCSFHWTPAGDGEGATWGLGANGLWQRPALGSGFGSVSLEKSLHLSGAPSYHSEKNPQTMTSLLQANFKRSNEGMMGVNHSFWHGTSPHYMERFLSSEQGGVHELCIKSTFSNSEQSGTLEGAFQRCHT